LTVDYFKSKTDPYDEDYGGSTAALLTRALSQVTDHVGTGHLVFVEDTSLRIEALSSEASDEPGMQVKHWFQATTFSDLDQAIERAGGDRRAIVKSDIALKVPGLDREILFHGETPGVVATNPPSFLPNPQYPWLTPDTFNGWLIPDGSDIPLGAMSLERSLTLDFRVRAFEQLIDRLEEYAAALNLPGTAYRRRRASSLADMPSLFSPRDAGAPPGVLVVGRTCAGKTTFAEYASGRHDVLYIEASAIVRSLKVAPLTTDDRDGYAFAKRSLDELGHDVVGREIVRRYGDKLDGPFVISGLRDIDEIRYLKQAVPRTLVVLVDASERTRFERHLQRARVGAEATLDEFRLRDSRQDAFGMLPVVDDLADVRILNEGKLEEYHRQIDAVLADGGDAAGVDLAAQPRYGPTQHQLYRCLKILADAGHALRCDTIEERSAELAGARIRHNNANKVLKAVPALALRLPPQTGSEGEQEAARVRYMITPSGVTYLGLLDDRWPELFPELFGR